LIERYEKMGELVEVNRAEGYIVVVFPDTPARFANSPVIR
jgi:hypothetical protein